MNRLYDNAQLSGYVEDLQRRLVLLEDRVSDFQQRTSIVTAPTNSTRSLNEPFTIDPDRTVLTIYTIELVVQAGLLSSQTATVALNVEGTAVDITELYSTQLLGLTGVGIQTRSRQQLVGVIPAGAVVELASSGNGTSTLVSSVELPLAI